MKTADEKEWMETMEKRYKTQITHRSMNGFEESDGVLRAQYFYPKPLFEAIIEHMPFWEHVSGYYDVEHYYNLQLTEEHAAVSMKRDNLLFAISLRLFCKSEERSIQIETFVTEDEGEKGELLRDDLNKEERLLIAPVVEHLLSFIREEGFSRLDILTNDYHYYLNHFQYLVEKGEAE